jgi:hypothetical protein
VYTVEVMGFPVLPHLNGKDQPHPPQSGDILTFMLLSMRVNQRREIPETMPRSKHRRLYQFTMAMRTCQEYKRHFQRGGLP